MANKSSSSSEKVWFITGCSTGFGRELAKMVSDRDYRIVITARDPAKVEDIAARHGDRALVLELDVTDPVEVDAAVNSAVKHFGRIDVLVNNAGIGYFGAVEESDEEEVRRMFEINFFGLAHMSRAVLPVMRKQRSGHIVNISSIGGLKSFPTLAYYNATKYAVEGFSEALALEVAPLGIKVTIVEPSGFRTDWAGRSAAESKNRIADYAPTAGKNLDDIRGYSGKQPGDPVRAAAAIIATVESPNPPLRLLLGKAALKGARAKLDTLKRDFDAWEKTTVEADFPDGS
ncbi:MAG TPA: oxidoreductase [Gemmatimonadaceae bacterium]|nr:oxidoreductase [Gemmatimonadaceae bacterium]